MKSSVSRGAGVVLATWFGCGYSPSAPGTAGSAAAVLIAWMLHRWHGWQAWHFAALAALLLWPAVWASSHAAEHFGRKDPPHVVVDEVVGQWIAIAGATALNPVSWLAAFLLFRALDIVKPPPARRLESLPAGIGVVADDVMAGVYAALVMYVAGWSNLY